jgi:hypothetical protein
MTSPIALDLAVATNVGPSRTDNTLKMGATSGLSFGVPAAASGGVSTWAPWVALITVAGVAVFVIGRMKRGAS